jgi:acetoacetate decarboxylase
MLLEMRRFRFCFPVLFVLALMVPGLSQETQKEFCMPRLSPLYGPPPVQFRDNRIISVVFRTTPEVLQELVPKPLLPNPYNLMFAYIGRLNIEKTASGSYEYLEAGIGVPAAFSKNPGNYAVCLYLNKALPIVGGREVWGWPKKDAEITFTETDGKINARVERFGTVLLSLSARLEKKVDPIPSQPEMPWYLLKIIPSVRKNAPPDVWQLVSTQNIGTKTKELWNCTATFEMGTGPQDALGNIRVSEIVSAQFSVGDFAMDYGEVLYDFLAKK